MGSLGNVFVTGTDTDVGKSVASAWLLNRFGGDYWKPIQSGLSGVTDVEFVMGLSGLTADRVHPSTFNLTEPLSPHASARLDGVSINLEDFSLPSSNNSLVVEGAGGLMVPLNKKEFIVDLIELLSLPVVLVVRSGLGTINHTLLSLMLLRQRGIEIAGVIMNGSLNRGNREAIIEYGKVDIIAEIPILDPLTKEKLAKV
ncbi:MAG: dethiobiotin synthase [Magnetococcales bacterium]|nr:dethiobiotin synthase [Magnetococcales bacterium]